MTAKTFIPKPSTDTGTPGETGRQAVSGRKRGGKQFTMCRIVAIVLIYGALGRVP